MRVRGSWGKLVGEVRTMLFEATWHRPAASSKSVQILSSSVSAEFASGDVEARVIRRHKMICA